MLTDAREHIHHRYKPLVDILVEVGALVYVARGSILVKNAAAPLSTPIRKYESGQVAPIMHTSAYVCIRQHTSAYILIYGHAPLHASYTPLTRLLHASYTPLTRLLHASYTPLTRLRWRVCIGLARCMETTCSSRALRVRRPRTPFTPAIWGANSWCCQRILCVAKCSRIWGSREGCIGRWPGRLRCALTRSSSCITETTGSMTSFRPPDALCTSRLASENVVNACIAASVCG
jgi:hypothetical protein